jgi:magnesium transporter
MIRCMLKIDGQISLVAGLPQPEHDRHVLWIEVHAPTPEETAVLRERFAVDARVQVSSVIEDDRYLYMRSQLLALATDGTPRFAMVTFALGETVVVTLSDVADFRPFGVALQRCTRRPNHAESPKAVLRVLLQVANDGAEEVIDRIADALESSADEILEISEGYNEEGQELGVADLIGTMRSLNEKEGLIARCLEAQLSIARTVRYLSGEVDDRTEAELQTLVTELMGDVAGVKEHAAFEHEKVRYLQNSVTNILNIKQNQISRSSRSSPRSFCHRRSWARSTA